ncbi:IclR family transcriptional regulator [Enemella dayhoffiae]|nr:IclR family transcriptional regulator [Enemella dayhoffiae]
MIRSSDRAGEVAMVTRAVEVEAPAGTLQRGLAILDLLALGERPTVSELIDRVGMSKSAAFRVLATLREHALVEWDSTLGGRVVPGERAVLLGVSGLRTFDPWEHGRHLLAELAHTLGESALMAIRDGAEMVYIAHEDHSDHMVGVRRLLGARRPAYASSLGKAYLAAMPDSELEPLLESLELQAFTPTTITSIKELRAQLAETRERGWAIDLGEHENGVMCFGVAVLDHVDHPVCSISVAGPQDRIRANQDRVIAQVTATARALSERMGHLDQQQQLTETSQ